MSKSEFVIPFIGLKIGNHVFEYDIDNAFFEGIELSIIHRGNVHVRLELEKKETMLIGIYHVDGVVTTDCDRCTDDIEVEVEREYQIIYKIGGDPSDDETLVTLEKDAYEIDVKMNIYELIAVSLPLRSVHKKEECNPEMLALLDKYVINSSEEDDEEDDDWDDEEDDSDFDDEDEDDDSDDDNNDDIDPRWSILKNLN